MKKAFIQLIFDRHQNFHSLSNGYWLPILKRDLSHYWYAVLFSTATKGNVVVPAMRHVEYLRVQHSWTSVIDNGPGQLRLENDWQTWAGQMAAREKTLPTVCQTAQEYGT